MKLAIVAFMLLFAGCIQPPVNQNNSNSTGIANPASVFCAEHNGTLELKTDASGQYGVCSFANGTKCEEWAYFRGECSPERPNYCEKDSDCACGMYKSTRDCFYGSKDFVDVTQQCPGFCNGIVGNLEVRCEQYQCKHGQKVQNCSDFSSDSCPSGCVVCPPCPTCSSIVCQTEEACNVFNKNWPYTVKSK